MATRYTQGLSCWLATALVCAWPAGCARVGFCDAESPGGLVPPLAPTGLIAVAGKGQIGLSWSASLYATTYFVLRATASAGPYAEVATSPATSFTDTGLSSQTTYYYVVQ